MKKIIGILLVACITAAGCASMEALQKKKTSLEAAITRQEKATKDEIAAIEAEMDQLIAVIDSSNSLSEDAKNNARIAELQEKVNETAVRGRDKVDKLSIKVRNLEHKITTRMNMSDLD